MEQLSTLDPMTFGRRLRHLRRNRGLTLEQLGAKVGRPAPYLSLVENGKREPRLSQISALAAALEVTTADLLDPTPPSRRAALEIELERAQADPRYQALGLAYLRPSTRVPDEALDHIVTLWKRLVADQTAGGSTALRRAVADVAGWLTNAGGYLEHVEAAARDAIARIGYTGTGPLTARNLIDLARRAGFSLSTVDDVPPAVRTITDEQKRTIYLPQRNELRTRQARKAVLQALAAHALEHTTGADPAVRLRQRVETAYFAGAVLVPEEAAVPFLEAAASERDLSVEDMRERFYVTYDMAAHRFSNLATRHLGIRSHVVVSDDSGIVWKAYQNDGVPLPTDEAGGSIGRLLCREFGGRQVFASDAKFDLHHQYTDTPRGTFWCATHLTADQPLAVTIGVGFDDARRFRGRDTNRHRISQCPDGPCCDVGNVTGAHATSRAQERIVGMLAGAFPQPDPADVAAFLERHRD